MDFFDLVHAFEAAIKAFGLGVWKHEIEIATGLVGLLLMMMKAYQLLITQADPRRPVVSSVSARNV